jgi:tetratricopeptide (TPR) repeat protein/DNA-binding CsgD family transcriptional regulator
MHHKDKDKIDRNLDSVSEQIKQDPASVILSLNRIAKLAQKHGYRYPEILYRQSSAYNILGETVKALGMAEESVRLLEKDSGTLLYAECLSHIGNVQCNLGNYEEALDALSRSKVLLEKLRERRALAVTYLRIGNVYRNFLRNTDKAIKSYDHALKLGIAAKDEYLIASSYGSLGNACLYKGLFNEAAGHYRRSEILFESNSHSAQQCVALLGLGTALRRLRQFDKAIDTLKKGLLIAVKKEFTRLETSLSLNLSLCYLESGDTKNYKKYFRRSVTMINMIGDRNLESNFHKGFAEVYAAKKDYRNAYISFNKYFDLYSEIFKEESERLNKMLRLKYEKEKADKEKEIYRLRAQELSREIEAKTKELNAMASYLSQKNEFVKSLVENVKKDLLGFRLEKTIEGYVQTAVKKAETASHMNEDLKRFETELDRFSFDFIEKLSTKFPSLSRVELKICSMIKINLSTKEIANLMYLSNRTVENHKYRISKKINLKPSQNFVTFLNSL